jgi:hypothetical protein
MLSINAIALDALPSSESDDLEYKSSLIKEGDLQREIQNAASAFWNSGGGVFFAGVDDKGKVDGGIPATIGRQSRTDWLGRIIAAVSPQGKYASRLFHPTDHPNINQDKCVLAIEYAPSADIPHQSGDKRYYIRAGAHTERAPHFLVDALYAKRHFRSPMLVHVARINNWSGAADFLHVEVIAATDAVALDVVIDFDPWPAGVTFFPIVVPVIDRGHPFGFRFEIERQPPFQSTLRVVYKDVAKESYAYSSMIDASKLLAPWSRDEGALGEIARRIQELTRAIDRPDRGVGF